MMSRGNFLRDYGAMAKEQLERATMTQGVAIVRARSSEAVSVIEGVTIRTDLPIASVEGFVLKSWLANYEPRGMLAHECTRKTYYATHHPAFARLLRSSVVAVAVVADDPDVFLGWACGAPGLLHYVYVKSACRGSGVAGELVRAVAGEAGGLYSFEPSTREGKRNEKIAAVAERYGFKFHAYPVRVREQRQANEQRAKAEATGVDADHVRDAG
jgi:GNAT superfamily N-acetyltransferase